METGSARASAGASAESGVGFQTNFMAAGEKTKERAGEVILKGMFFLWVGRIVFILVVLFVVISLAAFFLRSSGPPSPPSIKDAPWVIQTYSLDEFQTPSRYYYAETVEFINGAPIAKGHWWSFDGKKYHKHSGDKMFSLDEYGKIDITRRS